MIPVLDGRDEERILETIKKLAPHYVPEWTFNIEDKEPGTVLSLIFSGMLKETIKRHNQVLQRNQMVFLDMLNAGILPAKPSEAYVTFRLSTGTKEHVLIPKATKVTAECRDKDGDVVFETADEMLATPAIPDCAFKIGADAKYINVIGNEAFNMDSEYNGFVLFEGEADGDLQHYGIYIEDSILFNIKTSAVISLMFINTKKKYRENENYILLSDKTKCCWEYLTCDDDGKEKWICFDKIIYAGNSLMLFKQNGQPIIKGQIEKVTGNFIRCRLLSNPNDALAQIEFNEVRAASQYMDISFDGGIKPDRLFINDVELKEANFYPFGEFYSIYDCFYICSEEVLSKKEARINLNLIIGFEHKRLGDEEEKKPIEWKPIMKKKDLEEVPEPSKSFIESVIWEYWNGEGWARLLLNEDYESMFSGPSGEINVIFNCPEDIEPVPVNGINGHFLRIRILKIWNAYRANNIYITPKISKISFKYEYIGEMLPLKYIYSLNSMEWKKHNIQRIPESEIVKPFEKMDCKYPAFFIGFSQPPLKGPIHLYFSLKRFSEEIIPLETFWEYYGKNGWTPLRVIDKTMSFSNSGSIIFNGASDFVQKEFFRKPKYWIRVLNRNTGSKASNIRIDGIYMNTVAVGQHESIYREVPEVSIGDTEVECQLSKYPIISEEVFINEVGNISNKEQLELLRMKEFEINYDKDEYGDTKDFWIKWKRVNDFLLSGPDDRHYMIDYSKGRIIFSCRRLGRKFFENPVNKIRVDYKVGGGSRGNVPAYSISKLKNSIAFVESVVNHEAAFGGCEIETQDQAVSRETSKIKHRGRAVTEEDIKALVLSSSRNVARAKCIPNLNGSLCEETGSIAVIILPKGETIRDDFFTELKEEVKRYILKEVSGMIAFEDKITVIGPVKIEISVIADVAIDEMEGILDVEKEISDKLTAYLNPQTGNFDKKGWEIGEHPHQSNFYTLIKSVKRVKYIENLVVNIYEIKYGKKLQIGFEKLDEMPYIIVANGEHQINVNVM
ncbi:MAG TPA: baseplate J/gp47 family protein [Clostridia bacterium]